MEFYWRQAAEGVRTTMTSSPQNVFPTFQSAGKKQWWLEAMKESIKRRLFWGFVTFQSVGSRRENVCKQRRGVGGDNFELQKGLEVWRKSEPEFTCKSRRTRGKSCEHIKSHISHQQKDFSFQFLHRHDWIFSLDPLHKIVSVENPRNHQSRQLSSNWAPIRVRTLWRTRSVFRLARTPPVQKNPLQSAAKASFMKTSWQREARDEGSRTLVP